MRARVREGAWADSLLPGYDSRATYGDGSCAVAIWGCTRPDSINFQSFATSLPPGPASACPPMLQAPGPQAPSAAAQRTRAPARVQAARTVIATAGDPRATFDDGSCGVAILGCLDSARRKLPIRGREGTSADCALRGCTHSRALNTTLGPRLTMAGAPTRCARCVDSDALNFDPGATVDAGSCYILGCSRFVVAGIHLARHG